MSYIPHTQQEIKEMLKAAGVSSAQELFSDIDKSLFSRSFRLPPGRSEFEVFAYLKELSKKNDASLLNLSGGGFYDHYIPAAVDKLASRPEFYTPYTPYQPECSQGTLQAIYEYQTLICRLTGMEAANASVYDGATALAESVLMANRITGRTKIIIDAGVNPVYRQIIKTYVNPDNCRLITAGLDGYGTDYEKIAGLLDENTSAVVLQNPNFLGKIDDYSDLIGKIQAKGSLAILSVYPLSLGLVKTPAEQGADIAAGEAQSLGNRLNFGGPLLGFIAVLGKYSRQLPGRIAGAATDSRSRRGFVLTLQAREQHIRRHKATSNICTNQNLCALRALIYLVLLGRKGFSRLSRLNYSKAQFARKTLSEINKVKVDLNYPVFNEFVIELEADIDKVYRQALAKGFLPGVPLADFYPQMKNKLLLCVTEKISREKILKFKDTLKLILGK